MSRAVQGVPQAGPARLPPRVTRAPALAPAHLADAPRAEVLQLEDARLAAIGRMACAFASIDAFIHLLDLALQLCADDRLRSGRGYRAQRRAAPLSRGEMKHWREDGAGFHAHAHVRLPVAKDVGVQNSVQLWACVALATACSGALHSQVGKRGAADAAVRSGARAGGCV